MFDDYAEEVTTRVLAGSSICKNFQSYEIFFITSQNKIRFHINNIIVACTMKLDLI